MNQRLYFINLKIKNRKIALKKFRNVEEYFELLKNNKKENLEEELRILYVALTRSKHKLYILKEKDYNYTYWWEWLNSINNGKFIK